MKICNGCGKKVDDSTVFCGSCGTKIAQEQKQVKRDPQVGMTNRREPNKVKKGPIIAVVVAVILLAGIALGKDSMMYSYYKMRADKEESPSVAVEYYVKALNLNYKDEIIEKIIGKISEYEDFEYTLGKLEGVVDQNDLEKMYAKGYVNKAKECYENKDYKKSLKYLEKAENYNYDMELFEYYEELQAGLEKDQASSEEDAIRDRNEELLNEIAGMGKEFIIPDSSTRHLSVEELQTYTKAELGFIRNEIFARNGYIFEREEYSNYFNGKSWYNPNPYFTGNKEDLNSVEVYNIELIQKLEK